MTIKKGNYWTSASDLNCPNKFFWCSKQSEIIKSQMAWKTGHPDANAGDCVHAEVGSLENETVLATSTCSMSMMYVCETRKKGTEFERLTFECKDLWKISEGLYRQFKS
jgi:hypothetical protein